MARDDFLMQQRVLGGVFLERKPNLKRLFVMLPGRFQICDLLQRVAQSVVCCRDKQTIATVVRPFLQEQVSGRDGRFILASRSL